MVPKTDAKNKKSSAQGENQGATDERQASASGETQAPGEASAAAAPASTTATSTAPSVSGSAPTSASTTQRRVQSKGKTIPGSSRPSVVSTDQGQHQAMAGGAKRTNTTEDEHLSKRPRTSKFTYTVVEEDEAEEVDETTVGSARSDTEDEADGVSAALDEIEINSEVAAVESTRRFVTIDRPASQPRTNEKVATLERDGDRKPKGALEKAPKVSSGSSMALEVVRLLKEMQGTIREQRAAVARMPTCPSFDGEGDVDQYIDKARLYIAQFPNDSESHKLRLLSTGLEGQLREVVWKGFTDGTGTPEDLFRALKAACVKKAPKIGSRLHNIRQGKREACPMFGQRIAGFARALMPKADPAEFDKFCLEFFVGGAHDAVKKRLLNFNPKTLQEAVTIGQEAEDEATRQDGKAKDPLDFLNNIGGGGGGEGAGSNESLVKLVRQLREEVAALKAGAKPVDEGEKKKPWTKADAKRPCHICGKVGHYARACKNATPEERARKYDRFGPVVSPNKSD